ncbi:hypothetical protein [Glaciimonas sp. PCH181]|uniref:hypothetical protein n=1 Tax=Glaciimonas sp. PCH181 TaxID=2133943 RepID=UPI000D3732A0|nr:hypothetical protein [Glaciimonas sp. PCH181]PUA18819.1 hypothetical protein C7W93_02580 [Glaciimonas sp. PCH181]
MPDTTALKQSPNSTQPTAEDHLPLDVTNYSKTYFLHEFAELGTAVIESITTCLEVIEKSTSTDSTTKSTTKFCAFHAEKLQTLAITSARLLGEYAIKHIAWINEDGPSPQQTMEAANNKHPQ